MSSLTDDRGYNQMFRPSTAMDIRTARRCDYMLAQMNVLNEQTRILEIGCGTGELAALLASKTNAQIIGSDICMPFIEEAAKKHQLPNLKFMELDFNHPDALDRLQFDYIVGNGILHHLYNNLDEALVRIRKLLTAEGKIIFLEPNLYNPYCFLIFNTTKAMRRWAKLEPDEMALRKKRIKTQLQSAGYVDIKVEYKDFLLPNIPECLIKTVIKTGALLEKIPLLKMISQSIFISAKNQKTGTSNLNGKIDTPVV
jgi:2-polyprenyl-3-methyl-5-hydroxy-6-metoxy-1,4-benzoquinol methylase